MQAGSDAILLLPQTPDPAEASCCAYKANADYIEQLFPAGKSSLRKCEMGLLHVAY
jgi:hypothetical protein